MKAKPFFLPITLLGLLSCVFLLPQSGDMSPSAVNMEIPSILGGWETNVIPPSEPEKRILSEDTTFSKAFCLRPRKGEFDLSTGYAVPDRLDISIVLSGHDLNNSIHRPERCMPAQGHVIGESSVVDFELSNGKHIQATRLLSVQSFPNEDKTKYTSMNCVTYYFFVGNNKVTHSHLDRTLSDVKDRLLYGIDQRWAYVSVSMWYGKLEWIEKEVGLEEADAKLKAFIGTFAKERINWDMISL